MNLTELSHYMDIVLIMLCAAIFIPIVIPEDETGSNFMRDFLVTVTLCAVLLIVGYLFSFN